MKTNVNFWVCPECEVSAIEFNNFLFYICATASILMEHTQDTLLTQLYKVVESVVAPHNVVCIL